MSAVRPPCVLIVDDNEQNRALAEASLAEEGYRIVLAAAGEEALRICASDPPDCVLLDIRMPGMNGLTVCDRIRALPRGAEMAVLFLTALRDLDTFESALRAGGDDFLTKPVRPLELIFRVRAALKVGSLNAERREHIQLMRRQRDDLMRAQLMNERLMTFVVHDLKGPVASIDLSAQMLLREPSLSVETRHSVRQMLSEARSMQRLIYNLLDLSKGQEGRLTPACAVTDLPGLVGEVLETLGVRAAAHEVRLEAAIAPRHLFADPDLLRRVLENLLDNAVRHAPEGSVVRVEATRQGQAIELRVIDVGRGIAPELADHIFERFVQAEHRGSATRSGRGLGLAFCKLAVEAHGGRIWVEPGSPGATFCVRLPDAAR